MSRYTINLSLIAACLVPLAAGCGDRSTAKVTSSAATSSATAASSESATGVAPSSSVVVTPPAPTATASYSDGESAFRQGRYGDAAGLFRAYTQSHADNAWGFYMLGLSAWKAGDREEALAGFDEALRLDPTHRKSLFNSARVLLETSRPREALDRVAEALAIEPLSSEGLRLLGRARHQLRQIDEAIDAYQRAIAIDDQDVWAMNNLGLIYIQQGRVDAALLPLARAVEIRGNVPVFQNNLGTALERAGHFAAARDAYQAALTADSTYTKASVGLGRVSGLTQDSPSGSVDLARLSGEFQAEVERWRSAGVLTQSVEEDSMARDTTAE